MYAPITHWRPITPDAGGRRTSALSKAFQCTVRYDDPLFDTFRKLSKPGTAHDANPRATEVRRKEFCELYDVPCGGRTSIRWHNRKDNVCHMIEV